VIDAVAVAWPIVDGSAEGIVAWVTGPVADPERVRAEASTRLPDYMVPKAIHAIETMPLNANGKIDRKALAAQLKPVTAEAPAS
jgi:acyl-CoA synthetase (AMP-forming)/AMP-acid ligase II